MVLQVSVRILCGRLKLAERTDLLALETMERLANGSNALALDAGLHSLDDTLPLRGLGVRSRAMACLGPGHLESAVV